MVNILSSAALKGLVLAVGAAKITQAGFLDDGCGYITDGAQFTLRGDGTVTTYCNDKVCSATTFSAINLNDCVANVLGELKPKPTNNSNCKDCAVEGFHIKCKCKTLAGDMNETSINVNEVLDNWNGYLSCHGAISDCYTVKWMCKPTDWWPEGSPPEILETDCNIWS